MPHQCTNCGRTFADGSTEMLSGCPDCGGNKFQFAPTAAAVAESFDGDGDSDSATSTSAAGTTAVGSSEPTDTTGTTTPDRSQSSESNSVTARAAETVRDWVSPRSSESTAPRSQSNRSPSPAVDVEPSEANLPADREFPEWPETARRSDDRADSNTGKSNIPVEPPATSVTDDENSAQADARSEVVPPDDLPAVDTDRNFSARSTESRRPVNASGGSNATDIGTDDDIPPEHGRVISEPSGERPSIEELRAELNEQFESIKILKPGQYELNLMELYNRDEYIISLQEDGRYVIEVSDSWRNSGDGEV